MEEGKTCERGRAGKKSLNSAHLCVPTQRPKDHCLSPPTCILRDYREPLGKKTQREFGESRDIITVALRRKVTGVKRQSPSPFVCL